MKIKLYWNGIEYDDFYYFYWWNWLPKEDRYWGYDKFWYDGPHAHFGLWYTNISWRTPWTGWSDDYE